MGHTDEPREYIPNGLTSKHAQWDSQWFYLRNDDGLFPAYTGWLIKEHPDNWNYVVVKTHQARLCPLLEALKCVRMEGLTAALVLSTVHHRRVLPLMSRPLRMDEMGLHALSQVLKACRMSNKALPNKEVATSVRAVVSGDFKPELMNSFPMKPDEDYLDMVIPSTHRRLGFVFWHR